MREILFRAKTESGRWIEGDLIHYQSGEVAIIEKPFSKYGYEATEICRRTLALPDTICQYTGLTDKNGNKIWENDIVAFHHYEFGGFSGMNEFGFPILNPSKERVRNYAIEFVNTFCTYGLRFRNKSIHFPCKLSTLRMHDVEVIGNIFDNADLLKGE